MKNLKLVNWLFEDTSVQKEYKTGEKVISEELKVIGCLSTEKTQWKDNSTTVQPRLHYSNISCAYYFYNCVSTG